VSHPQWTAPRLELAADVRAELATARRVARISSGQLCQLLGTRGPGTFASAREHLPAS
jgi:hypothetical protein